MTDETAKEIWERLTATEQSCKSSHRRIDNIEKLIQSISDMVVEVKHMREDLNKMHDELDEVKSRPAKIYDKFIYAAVGAVASGLVSIVLNAIVN